MRTRNATFVAVRTAIIACGVGISLGLIGVPAASAITFNFNSPTGLLGTTQTYTASGKTITAAGFTSNTFSTATALFGKADGGDENGVGLNNNVNHEISGTNLIRLALPTGLTNIMFTMNSTTNGEGWQVFGSNTPGGTSGYVSLLTGNDEGIHSLPLESFYYFVATGGGANNVLLNSLTATATPLPAALLLFGTGLAGLGILGRRKKRSAVLAT